MLVIYLPSDYVSPRYQPVACKAVAACHRGVVVTM